jgi:hypothetical protein
VSSLSQLAVEKFNATHLLHADCDEFFFPEKGSLKEDLPTVDEIYLIPRIHYVAPSRSNIASIGLDKLNPFLSFNPVH